ncbi:MAG: hypothetical protein MZV65_31735 [Chromatiales bacterium]|nr:hypothetical protein [Chromatiales bacterium]
MMVSPCQSLATATVTGQFRPPGGPLACSPTFTADPADPEADWARGVVVFRWTAADLTDISRPAAILMIWVDTGTGPDPSWAIRFDVLDDDSFQSRSALFPDRAQAVDALLQRLRRSPLGASLADLGSTALWDALRAAEVDAEHALRVFFSPTVVLPESATDAERDALDVAGTRWTEEPGYDLENEFFMGERWGYLVTRQRPLISVERVQFVYPRPASGIFDIPLDWIRLDKKYGHIRFVPGTQAFAAPLSIGILQAIGGGRGIPQAIQVRYTAGLRNATSQFPELVDLVRRMALLRLLQMQFLPASNSISADGLSESISVDFSKDQADIDGHLERLRQVIHGVQVSFL